MSLDNITSLSLKFKTHEELQSYANTQYVALQDAFYKIKQLEEQVLHLKSLLNPEHRIEEILVPTEQQICEMEIDKLRKTSMERSLTLEETKRLDLYIKNLYLIKGTVKDIETDFKRLPPGITRTQLEQIAAKPEPVVDEG